jgi:hypothetical protein
MCWQPCLYTSSPGRSCHTNLCTHDWATGGFDGRLQQAAAQTQVVPGGIQIIAWDSFFNPRFAEHVDSQGYWHHLSPAAVNLSFSAAPRLFVFFIEFSGFRGPKKVEIPSERRVAAPFAPYPNIDTGGGPSIVLNPWYGPR